MSEQEITEFYNELVEHYGDRLVKLYRYYKAKNENRSDE